MPQKNEVEARVAGILDLQRRQQAKLDEALELRRQVGEETEALAKFIAGGASSDDPLRDMVLRVHGVKPEFEEKYRKLEEQLAGKAGQFVLIRYSAKIRVRFGGDIGPSDYRHETRMRIGVLKEETLRLNGYAHLGTLAITLPVERYLSGALNDGAFGPAFEGTAVTADNFFEHGHEDHPPTLLEYLLYKHLAEDLLIGDEVVRAVLAEAARETGLGEESATLFATAAERLGRLILQPTPG